VASIPRIDELATVVVDSMFGPVKAFPNDHATRQLIEFGAHTRNEVAMLRRFVDPGDVVFDIGAHIGTFALPLAAAVGPSGHVVAVEADARSFALLRWNLAERGLLGRVTPIHAVAGGGDGRYRAVTTPDHTSASWFVAAADGEAMTGIALDDIRDRLVDPRRAAVIKIDVEGMELAVLRSAERTVTADRPILYIEIAAAQLARYGTAPMDIERFLRPPAYRLFRNVGPRNSTNDRYRLEELRGLAEGGAFFDVLAIPAEHPRLARALG
jgi:FkbM family methyltransferase